MKKDEILTKYFQKNVVQDGNRMEHITVKLGFLLRNRNKRSIITLFLLGWSCLLIRRF